MTYAVTVPLVALGAASVKLAADFDAALRNIASISPDFAANFDEMGQRILQFGATTRSGAQAAAEAFYQITSAGILDANDAFAIMEQSVFTAEAGLADLTATTKGLTSALLAFDAASDPAFANMSEAAEHYGNVLTRAVQLGVGSMNEFVPALGRAAAAAAMAGSSYDQLASAAAFLTQRGITVYNAGTAMNNVFNKLISPTDRLRQAFTQLGVTTSKELFEKFGDLQGVLRALEGVFGDSAEAWGEAFNSIQAKRAIFGIMNNFEDFEQFMKDFNNGLDTATKTAWLEQMKSFEGQVGLMSSAIKGLATQIGQVLLPILLPLIGNITAFFQQAMKLNPEILKLIIGFAALAAAVGPLVWLIGTLLSPMGILIGLVGGLGIALSTNLGGIGDTIKNAVSTAVPSLGRLAEAVQGFIDVVAGPGNSAYAFNDYFQGQMEMLGANFGGGGPGKSTAFHVNPGDTLSGLTGSTGLTIEQMMQAAGITDPRLLQPGDYVFTEAGADNPNAGLRPTTGNSGFGDRLAQAWRLFGQQIMDAISGAINEVITWVKTDGAFAFGELLGTIGAELYRAVATFFLADKSGGDAGGFVSTFASNLSAGIQAGIENAGFEPGTFNNFVSNVVTAIITAFAAWKFIGILPLGGFVQGLIGAIVSSVVGGSVGTAVAGGAASGGIGATIGRWIGNQLSTIIAGGIGFIKLLPMAVSMIADGIYGAFVDILSVGPGFWLKYNFGAVGGALASVGSTIVGLLGAILSSPVTLGAIVGSAIYALIPQEARDSIGQAVLNVFTTIFGQDPVGIDEWRTGVFADIAGWLASVFELFGNEDQASKWWQIAHDAAASIGDDIMEGFKSGLISEFESTDPIPMDELVAHALDPAFLVGQSEAQGMINQLNENQLPGVAPIDLGSNPKRASGKNDKNGGPLKAFFDTMKTDVQTGMTSVNTEFTNQFTLLGTTVTTGVTNTQLGLNNLVLAIAASIPLMAVALAGFNLTVLIGMSALLLTVTTFADLIIGKWNEMLMTLGSAPVNVGYTPGGAYGGAGGNTTVTTNVFVKTDNPNKINESLKKQNVNLYSGKIERTEI